MKEYRFCPTCSKNGKFVFTDHVQFVLGHYRDVNGFCSQCKYGVYESKNAKEAGRAGEGYIVIAIRQGEEITVTCPQCKGEGILFVREYFVSDKHKPETVNEGN